MADEEIIVTIGRHTRPDGSINSTTLARELGKNRSTVQGWLKRLAIQGRLGHDPVLPGFGIRSISQQTNSEGDVEKEWIKQAPIGEKFKIPENHTIKGISAYIDAGGNTIAKWVKTKSEITTDLLVDNLRLVFDHYQGMSKLIVSTSPVDSDLVTFYNISDHHLGLLAWGKETGTDYDLEIGEKLLMNSMSSLVSSSPKSGTAVVLNLGDFLHSDNNNAETERSNNKLDVDGRYAKVLQVGIKLLISCIELALQKHEKVIVRCLPGNHDPHTSLALSAALAAFFHNNTRVFVDCDPGRFFWFTFGKVFIAATHGDMVKPSQMPGVMASMRAKEWGEAEHRYAYFGHVHHQSRGGGENYGVVWETFRTLSAKDAWHIASGYVSGRSMVSITHHRDKGEICRNTVSVN